MGKIEKILDKEAKTINQIIDDHEALKEAVKKICICPKDLPKNIAISNCPAHNPLPQPEKQPEVGSCKRCGLPLSQCSEGRWEKPLCVDRNGTEYDEHIVGLSTLASYGQKREQVGREKGIREAIEAVEKANPFFGEEVSIVTIAREHLIKALQALLK